VTGPRADWPGPVAPTERQVDGVRAAIMRRSLDAMRAELRFEYAGHWGLEVVGERDGERAVFFGEGIEATAERATEAATARLALAGYQVRGWSKTVGGWNGDLS